MPELLPLPPVPLDDPLEEPLDAPDEPPDDPPEDEDEPLEDPLLEPELLPLPHWLGQCATEHVTSLSPALRASVEQPHVLPQLVTVPPRSTHPM